MVKFPRAESDETTIRLEGKETVVNKVISAIQDFVRDKEDQVTVTVDVPQNQHRVLIGRGGDTRRQLETQFNVMVDVPKQGSGRTEVRIKGPSNAVEDAKAHILSMIKEQHRETVQVPANLHHTVAENGSFFRRLRNEYKVTVDHAGTQIPPRPDVSDSRDTSKTAANASLPLITDDPADATNTYSWKIVDVNASDLSGDIPWVLSGTPEDVAKAKAVLEKAMAAATGQSATGYLILPDPKTYRFVIGPGGSQINAIRKRTGCKINVPKDQAKGEAIEIKGSKDSLETAKEMILEAVKNGSNGSNGDVGRS
jgi:polyribonucleotide nucleotidyltransferase